MGEGKLEKIGGLWKPKPGAKSFGSGSITVNGMRQRFVIFKNDRKKEGSKQPDYNLLSSDPPERDEYAGKGKPAAAPAEEQPPAEDDIPF